jgi:5-methylcytosine-specific restriction protein A
MPSKPLRPCAVPGCPEIAVAHGRCAAHQNVSRAHDDRPSAAARGYGHHWRMTRARFLRACPTCELCGAPATVAHHIVPLEDGGADTWDNLQALCAACHNRVHDR